MAFLRGRWTFLSLVLFGLSCFFTLALAFGEEDLSGSGTFGCFLAAVVCGAGFWGVWRGEDGISRLSYLLFPAGFLLGSAMEEVAISVGFYYSEVERLAYFAIWIVPAVILVIVNEIRIRKEPYTPAAKPLAPVASPTPPSTASIQNAGSSAPSSNSVEVRLQKIESLKAKGMITEAEYQTRRKRILDSL